MNHHDPDSYWRSTEFFLGDHLLVVPMTREDEGGRFLYLPEGDWFSYHDDTTPKEVKKDIWVECGLDRIPVYVKAGAVLPHWPLQQFVGEIPNPVPELHVWWKDGRETSFWYEDAGDGESWREGDFRESTFEVTGTMNSLEIRRDVAGKWSPSYEKIVIVLRGLPETIEATTVEIDGRSTPISRDAADRTVFFALPGFEKARLSR